MTPLRSEEQLLLACARRGVGATEGAELSPLLADIRDWDYALKIARYHQVVPLLHRALVLERAQPLAVDHAESLQRRFDESATWARRLAGELIRVMELAGRAGVALMPFKGPVLATAMAAANPALRRRIGRNAEQAVQAHALDVIAAEYEAALGELTG